MSRNSLYDSFSNEFSNCLPDPSGSCVIIKEGKNRIEGERRKIARNKSPNWERTWEVSIPLASSSASSIPATTTSRISGHLLWPSGIALSLTFSHLSFLMFVFSAQVFDLIFFLFRAIRSCWPFHASSFLFLATSFSRSFPCVFFFSLQQSFSRSLFENDVFLIFFHTASLQIDGLSPCLVFFFFATSFS